MGVPVGGWLDSHHALLCNQRLGNRPENPLIEIIGPGAEIEVLENMQIAFTGANAEIRVDEALFGPDSIRNVFSGQIIRVGQLSAGNVIYLGLAGRIWNEKNAVTTNRLIKGMTVLGIVEKRAVEQRAAHMASIPVDLHTPIQVMAGPEFSMLGTSHLKLLSESQFTISARADRMAFLLDGPEIKADKQNQMLTSAVMPGVIQWLPAGKMLVLMRDCQTTGGYPRVLILEESQINKIAQRPPGSMLRLEICK